MNASLHGATVRLLGQERTRYMRAMQLAGDMREANERLTKLLAHPEPAWGWWNEDVAGCLASIHHAYNNLRELGLSIVPEMPR